MANTTSNKLPIQKNVIYDSGNDVSTGRKRAVDFTGGVSVAERARLFGTQIKHSSATKNPQLQRPTVNKQQQPIKSNVIHQDRNYQSYNDNRYPKQDTTYTSPERISHNDRSFSSGQIDERPKREPSPLINSQNYSTVTQQPYRQHQQYQQQQQPASIYDSFQYRTQKEQPSIKPSYSQIIPGDSYTYDDDPFYQSYQSQQSLPIQSNYFQPIQDPLEALYRNSAPIYSQPPVNNHNNLEGMQAFDLGNLINRIQEDYVNNVRPYVSSVQFIQDEQNLANISVLTPSSRRKDYSRRNNDIYLRQGASYHYDIIDMNGLYPMFTKPSYNDKRYSSTNGRRRRRRYHDQALSPIHIFESSNKPQRPPSPPAAPIEKPATPVAANLSEEEDTTVADTRTTEVETSSESEEESKEDVVATTSAKPVTEPQRNEITRPTLPNQTPSTAARLTAKPVASESSESEESDSDSDSDSDDDEEDEKPKPAPAARFNNTRTTPATPQTTNTRVVPLRTATRNNDITNQPPETSHSVQSFDLETSKKSSGIGGRFRSIFNKFRRKKKS